jgi:hypothetical protein
MARTASSVSFASIVKTLPPATAIAEKPMPISRRQASTG